MKTKPMGRTGLKVSEICLGTMTFGYQADEATSLAILEIAAEAGINFLPRGKEMMHVALAWVLGQPGISSTILGASRPEQLEHGLAGVSLELNEEEKLFCNDLWFSLPKVKDPKFSLR